MIRMKEIRISKWNFILIEMLVIAAVAMATYSLLHLGRATPAGATVPSTTYSPTSTIMPSYSGAVPYLTSSDMSAFFGNMSNSTYENYYCRPSNATNPGICNNVAFFSKKGQFSGWIIQYKASGLNLDEMLIIGSNNSSYVYGTLSRSMYPNTIGGYNPANVIINATENGAIYSSDFNQSYDNIYMLKGDNAAFVYISGTNYSQNYTQGILETVSKEI